MLEEQINGFIEYCKVSGFRDRSIESLSIIIIIKVLTPNSFQIFYTSSCHPSRGE